MKTGLRPCSQRTHQIPVKQGRITVDKFDAYTTVETDFKINSSLPFAVQQHRLMIQNGKQQCIQLPDRREVSDIQLRPDIGEKRR